jgi:hypothetical protein
MIRLDGMQWNPGVCGAMDFPDYAMLHPGYLLSRGLRF